MLFSYVPAECTPEMMLLLRWFVSQQATGATFDQIYHWVSPMWRGISDGSGNCRTMTSTILKHHLLHAGVMVQRDRYTLPPTATPPSQAEAQAALTAVEAMFDVEAFRTLLLERLCTRPMTAEEIAMDVVASQSVPGPRLCGLSLPALVLHISSILRDTPHVHQDYGHRFYITGREPGHRSTPDSTVHALSGPHVPANLAQTGAQHSATPAKQFIFVNTTAEKIAQKQTTTVDPARSDTKNQPFTAEEDVNMLRALKAHGFNSWHTIMQYLPVCTLLVVCYTL